MSAHQDGIITELDTIGQYLCEDAHGYHYTVQQYVDFAKRTQWTSLRKYLLDALSYNWSQRSLTAQYRVLKDLNELRKASEHKSIDAFWKDLQDVYFDTDQKYRHLIEALVEYNVAKNDGWPLYEDRDIEEESPKSPSFSSRHIHDLAPRQTHARSRSRSRSRSASQGGPTAEMSRRKQVVYGYRV